MKHLSMYHLSVLLCLLVLSGCVADTALPVGTTPASTISPASPTTSTSLLEPPVRAEVPPAVTASPVPLTVEAEPCPATGPSPSLRCDKEVLLAVRDRLRGEHRELLRTWHPDNSIYNFQGIVVTSDAYRPRVVGLQWIGWWADPQVRLVGSIPPELGRLAELELLDLAGNGLTGSIPAALGQLARLRRLYLNANRLTGPIPAELGQLAQLQYLRLNHNQLTGPLPPELGQLSRLRRLNVSHNRLTDPVPAELGQLSALQVLYLHANEVTGPVPAEWGWFTVLHADEETGSLPAEKGWSEPCPAVGPSPNLRCDKEVLLAVRDRLRGEHRELLRTWHPDNSIYNFQGVVVRSGDGVADVVGLHWIGWWSDPGYRLVGSLPPELGRLPDLAYITLRENGLRGPIPPEWGQLTQLKVLDLAGNALTGSIPPTLDRLALKRLDLSGNQLTGPIPPTLRRYRNLRELNLSRNGLEGPILVELEKPGQLPELNGSHIRLPGPISPPPSASCPETGPSPSLRCDKEVLLAVRDRLRGRWHVLGTWQPHNPIENFEGVSLGGDPRRVIGLEIVRERGDASGVVPWQLSRLPRLERLVLRGNGLQGLIPPALGQLPRLRTLDLSGNWLRETIPAELGQLRELRELHLQDNPFMRGSIPPELCQLAHLRVLAPPWVDGVPPAGPGACLQCPALPRCE